MPVEPKKASEPVSCGINKYVDFSFGTAHGQWHATEKQAVPDKKAVEGSAENEAWIKAQREAVDVAERECPRDKGCPNKRSPDDPDPVKPWYRPAEVIESVTESEAGKGWRWHAKARIEYQVLFECPKRGE